MECLPNVVKFLRFMQAAFVAYTADWYADSQNPKVWLAADFWRCY